MPKIVLKYSPYGRRRLGRPLKRQLDDAETGLSKFNSWRVMMMMMMMNPSFHVSAMRHHLSLRVHDHTQTPHIWCGFSGQVIGSSPRPLSDNTQHSQETDIYAFCGIRTSSPSKRAAENSRLRPRRHWDRLIMVMMIIIIIIIITISDLKTGFSLTPNLSRARIMPQQPKISNNKEDRIKGRAPTYKLRRIINLPGAPTCLGSALQIKLRENSGILFWMLTF